MTVEMLSAMKMLAERAHLVRTTDLFDENIVPSPCISVCKMDARLTYCQGCLRTIDEIGSWGQLDNVGKRAIWQRLEARMP